MMCWEVGKVDGRKEVLLVEVCFNAGLAKTVPLGDGELLDVPVHGVLWVRLVHPLTLGLDVRVRCTYEDNGDLWLPAGDTELLLDRLCEFGCHFVCCDY